MDFARLAALAACTTPVTATLTAGGMALCASQHMLISASPRCAPEPVNVVLVQPLEIGEPSWLRNASDNLVERLRGRDDTRIGVVHYTREDAKQVLGLTTDLERARPFFRRPEFALGYNIEGVEFAAREAVEMLEGERSRRDPDSPLGKDFVVFFALGKDHVWSNVDKTERASQIVQASGASLVSACGARTDVYCNLIDRMATDDWMATRAPDPDELADIVERALRDTRPTASVVIEAAVPRILDADVASAVPPPSSVTIGVTTTVLSWAWPDAELTGTLGITFTVRAAAEGTGAVHVSARTTDRHGGVDLSAAASQSLLVAGSVCPVPTPATPTHDVPPAPTAAPLPTRHSVFLPSLMRAFCLPRVCF